MSQFDLVLSNDPNYDRVKEDIFLECILDSVLSTVKVLGAAENINKRQRVAPIMLPRFNYLYEMFRVQYIMYWEQHWESLDDGAPYPFDIAEVILTMEKENIPRPDKPTFRDRLIRNRVTCVDEDGSFIISPQKEVW